MSFVLPGGAPSSVVAAADYAGLRQQVARWLNRTDLDAEIPNFVRMAEQEHRRDVRAQAMEQVVAGNLLGSSINYPIDFLQARMLTVGGCQYQFASLSAFRTLQHVNILRKVFTSVGETLEVLGGNGGAYVLDYWAAIPQLEEDTDSNWLLQNAYDLYLWKACEKGSVWLRDAEGAVAFKGLYDDALARLNQAEYEKRFSGSELTMLSPGVV